MWRLPRDMRYFLREILWHLQNLGCVTLISCSHRILDHNEASDKNVVNYPRIFPFFKNISRILFIEEKQKIFDHDKIYCFSSGKYMYFVNTLDGLLNI